MKMKTTTPKNGKKEELRPGKSPMTDKPEHAARTLPAFKHENAPDRSKALTEIAAKIDAGFGNQLFIRGQGGGLSWEQGTPLHCANASTWVWFSEGTKGRITFKLLLNDQVWANGEDLVVEAGQKIETFPQF